jgi:hypothetical protein
LPTDPYEAFTIFTLHYELDRSLLYVVLICDFFFTTSILTLLLDSSVSLITKMATTAKEVAAASTQPIAPTPAAQQSDNVAHALAGAGGGILSTALTYDFFNSN